MRFLTLLGLAAFPFLGCGNPPDRWVSRGDRVLGIGSDRAEDPVSGSMVSKDKAVKREYLGATYYFQSSRTAATFFEHPDGYAIHEIEGNESPSLTAPVSAGSEVPR